MSAQPPRRRISLGPALVAAMVLAALVPALLVSWLLSSNSSQAIETLAENAMSQAAHRVDVGALAHLGESHTVVNALVPPFATTGAEAERTRNWLHDTASFELMAYALTQQSANVPYLYFGTEDGSFFGLEREDVGFIVRTIRPGESGRRHYQISGPGDRSRLVKTEDKIYDPRQRPWYRLAASTGQRVFTNVYRSAVKNQFDLTLAHPIYAEDQRTLLGVMAVDMSLARLTDLIRSTRVSDNAVTYLVDAQGLMVATSENEDLNRPIGGKYQRIKPAQSNHPLVRASYERLAGEPNRNQPGLIRMQPEQDWKQDWLQRLGLVNNRLMALQRPFGQKYGLDWRLVVVAPEQDFTAQVTRARQWALAAMAGLIGVSALAAFVVGGRLSGQFRLLNAAALRLGAGQMPDVQKQARFREVHNLSQVMHDSAVQLKAYHAEVQQKNQALSEAAQLLEQRVVQRTAELAASREEALAAVQAKAGFLAVMSHEIRTPLHGVVGMSELLADSALSPRQRDLVQVLQVSSEQLLSVVDDILDVSKIESGKLALEQQALDVRATVAQACDMVRQRALEKALALHVDIAPEVPAAVLGDATRLRQVLLNLLSNAIKFTEQGHVRLRVWSETSAAAPMLCFSVTDTGPGIGPERQAQLFQPFAQGDTSTARVHGGTGLGLMICKHLAEMMGGGITVQSTPGAGACFRVCVRTPAADPTQVPAPRHAVLPVARPGQRVLVVDDNPVNLRVAAAMLQRLGYAAEGVDSGEQALQALEASARLGQTYGLVLLDSHMPVMDGVQTAQAIVQRWGSQAPPLVGLSASSLGSDRERGLAAGMVDHLPKPLTLDRLASTLAHWCRATDPVATPPEATSAAEDATQPPVLDTARWQLLSELDAGAGQVREEIAQSFLQALPERCKAIEQAASTGDTAAVAQAAHGLMGAAQNLGLVALGAVCEQLEAVAQAGHIDTAALAGLAGQASAARTVLGTPKA